MQIISYLLFDRLLITSWTAEIGGAILGIGLVVFFFATYFIKLKGLEWILRLADAWKIPKKMEKLNREQRYMQAREGRTESQQALAEFTDSVIQANAASFTAILLLLLLRQAARSWA